MSFLKALLVAGALLPVGLWSAVAAPATRPNVLVILADDLGYADLGVQGSPDIPTPHLDRLAAQGIRCTSGYSSHPYCSPMRAGLLAARYQHRFGYERNIAYDPQNAFMGIPASETLVPARLQKAGYATGGFGKWHLGASMPFAPNKRGFDYFYGFRGGGHDYFTVDLNRPMGEGYQQPIERNGTPEGLDGYLTTRLAEEASAFIERSGSKPFFVYLAFNAPHTPMQAPEAFLKKFTAIKDKKRQTYAAMVHAMDEAIGGVLATLDRLALRENTLVFFLSDNGGPENANASDNGPLRGQKGDIHEGGIRVPFIVSWPAGLPQGRTYEHPVISLDVSRTALELAGAPLEANLEGVNLMPHLSGKETEPPHAALFWRMENGESWAVRSGTLKLAKTKEAETPSLYDLAADIGEQDDLLVRQPADAKRLTALFEDWNRQNVPPFFPGFREYHPAVQQLYREISAPAKR